MGSRLTRQFGLMLMGLNISDKLFKLLVAKGGWPWHKGGEPETLLTRMKHIYQV